MELAAVLRGMGLPVTVIEAGPAPLARAVPPRFAAALYQRHLAEGVCFRLGETVAGIDADGVLLARQAGSGGLVVSAIGVALDIALARAAGLATGDGS